MTNSVQLTRSRLVRWQDGDAWRQGWVMVGAMQNFDVSVNLCDDIVLIRECTDPEGASVQGDYVGASASADVLLVHDPLTRNLYLVPADAVEDVPMRADYEGHPMVTSQEVISRLTKFIESAGLTVTAEGDVLNLAESSGPHRIYDKE